MYSLQDYSLISTIVSKFKQDYEIEEDSLAFYFFVLDLLLNISDTEARDSITDNFYLKKYAEFSGHDRGIDAVYIDEESTPVTVHFFNFKYAMTFEKSKSNVESTEIDKIEGFLKRVMLKEVEIKNEVNAVLYSKVEEIWELFKKENPNFVIHIASNNEFGFESGEQARFERAVKTFSNISIDYFIGERIVDQITSRTRKRVDAKIKAIDLNLFEKGDGSIRALIVNLDARDVIRAIVEDEGIRNNPDFSDYEAMHSFGLCEDAFEDNVRLYLKRETRINNNIVETALSEENYQFFYFNNGITITCDHFSYPKNRRTPIIEIENLQIVNGGQTLHALYEAMVKDSNRLASVNLLCRIYETKDKELSSKIAEYTNSQNPVNNRDIHSIDSFQIKLEREFLAMGYYYERKRNQHSNQPKGRRIDAEKLGQAILAINGEKPSEAKNQKKQIFDVYYDEVFNSDLRASDALLAYKLFEFVEEQKAKQRKKILEEYSEFGYLSYSSYWILYLFKKISGVFSVPIKQENIDYFKRAYSTASEILKYFAQVEREKKGNAYSHGLYFKYNLVRKAWEEMRDSEEVTRILNLLR